MSKAKELLKIAEETSPTRRIVRPKKRMHVSEITDMVAKFVADRRFLPEKQADEFALFYLTGEFTLMTSKPLNYIEGRYNIPAKSAKLLWDQVEQHFKHYREFLETHDDVVVIEVEGKNITGVEWDKDYK